MDASLYDWAKLILENVSIWPLLALVVLVWISRQEDLMRRLTKVSFGGVEFQLQELKEALEESKLEIKALENDLERERTIFNEILEGFDPNAPVSQLGATRDMLVANARSLDDLGVLKDMLSERATPQELFAAATTLRERRPTSFFGDLVTCLDRLADDRNLRGVRLHTVWTLTSALHRILIAAIRDGVTPPIASGELKRAAEMLDKLEVNPRVLADRPDNPEKGVRGPARLARNWIERGLAKQGNGGALGKSRGTD